MSFAYEPWLNRPLLAIVLGTAGWARGYVVIRSVGNIPPQAAGSIRLKVFQGCCRASVCSNGDGCEAVISCLPKSSKSTTKMFLPNVSAGKRGKIANRPPGQFRGRETTRGDLSGQFQPARRRPPDPRGAAPRGRGYCRWCWGRSRSEERRVGKECR